MRAREHERHSPHARRRAKPEGAGDHGTIASICARLPQTLTGIRHRAVLTVGWTGGFRRSELSSFDLLDVAVVAGGLELLLRKRDQEGVGVKIAIPYGTHPETCPVRALLAWIEAAQITSGPLFRVRSLVFEAASSLSRLFAAALAGPQPKVRGDANAGLNGAVESFRGDVD